MFILNKREGSVYELKRHKLAKFGLDARDACVVFRCKCPNDGFPPADARKFVWTKAGSLGSFVMTLVHGKDQSTNGGLFASHQGHEGPRHKTNFSVPLNGAAGLEHGARRVTRPEQPVTVTVNFFLLG